MRNDQQCAAKISRYKCEAIPNQRAGVAVLLVWNGRARKKTPMLGSIGTDIVHMEALQSTSCCFSAGPYHMHRKSIVESSSS